MKQKKLSLANIQGKLSRAEMKKIMAGSDDDAAKCRDANNKCNVGGKCTLSSGGDGKCYENSSGTSCYCGS